MSTKEDLIISLLQDTSKKQSDKLDQFQRELSDLRTDQEVLEEKLSTLKKFLTYIGCGTVAALVSIVSTLVKILIVK